MVYDVVTFLNSFFINFPRFQQTGFKRQSVSVWRLVTSAADVLLCIGVKMGRIPKLEKERALQLQRAGDGGAGGDGGGGDGGGGGSSCWRRSSAASQHQHTATAAAADRRPHSAVADAAASTTLNGIGSDATTTTTRLSAADVGDSSHRQSQHTSVTDNGAPSDLMSPLPGGR